MRQQRRELDPAWIVAASRRIQKQLLEAPEFDKASAVACYLALPVEVQLSTVLQTCWEQGKRTAVPAFNESNDRYELVWIGPEDRTTPGRWNIAEPDERVRAGLTDLDLLIVPALAYDHHGGRLGYGGGHYDRMLGSWSGLRVGVAFDFQVFERVPMGSQDLPVDRVYSELRMYDPEHPST
jgi:5-formyltetrahydrofolate cyclo-ligase